MNHHPKPHVRGHVVYIVRCDAPEAPPREDREPQWEAFFPTLAMAERYRDDALESGLARSARIALRVTQTLTAEVNLG